MVSFVGIFTVEGQRFATASSGDLRSFHVGFFALDHLQNVMRNYAMVAAQPIADQKSPANKLLYDVSMEPICHDFIIWVVTAIMSLRREGIAGPLQISLAKRNDVHEYRTQRDMPSRDAFVNN